MLVIAFRANVQGLYVYELMRNGNLTALDKHLYEEEVDQKKCLRKHHFQYFTIEKSSQMDFKLCSEKNFNEVFDKKRSLFLLFLFNLKIIYNSNSILSYCAVKFK